MVTAAEAAREVAKAAYDGTAWNYDHVECRALAAVGDAFTRFAELIEDAEPITPAEQRTGVSDVARLDRIAVLVPQVATAPDGRPLWHHTCGAHHAKEQMPETCSWCCRPGAWRALYTVAGAGQ